MENLDILVAVVEQKSVNRASNELNLSQPAVSRKIMSLEEHLGVKLFDRKGKRLTLTRAGQICYEYAVRMLQLENEMLDAFTRLREESAPLQITIGASLTTLQTTLPDLIMTYTGAFPGTDINALTGKTHEVITLVKDKKVDLGLIASRADQSGVHCVPLFDDHLGLVLPAGHPLLELPSITMNDLSRLPMILFSRGTWYRVLMDDIFKKNGVYPEVRMEIDSFEAIIRLIPSLRTAALLPMSYLRRQMLADSELTVLQLPELAAAKRTTSLVFTEEAAQSAHIRLFVEAAQMHFAGRTMEEASM